MKLKCRRVIKKPYSYTFRKYGKSSSSITTTKRNALSSAKNLRRLGYKVKVKALKKPYCVR